MNKLRSIFSVIIGYFIFAVSAFGFFKLSGRPPHQPAPALFMIGSIVVGATFALIGGYMAASLAKCRPLAHGFAVAVVIALGAAASLISTFGKGAIWSRVSALVLIAPCAALGGWLRARQVSRK